MRVWAEPTVCAILLLVIAACASVLSAPAAAGDGTVRARAVFVGDVMVHDRQLEAARFGASWDFRPHFRRVKPLFEGCLSAANLETVFAGEAEGFAGYPRFNTPDALAPALVDLGIDAVMLANNHILDRGSEAAQRTANVLEDARLSWTGLAPRDGPDEPLLVTYGGLRWAFVNFSYGSNRPEPFAESEGLRLNVLSERAVVEGLARAAALKPDITVAFLHWGVEYRVSPSDAQRRMAALCLKNGADLVIGAHPHVVQPVEVTASGRGPAVVAYSLGNFVSFQRTLPRERSVVLAVDVEKKPGGRATVSRVSIAPTWVSARWENGRRKIEVVYAGGGGRFNHAGLPAGEIARARAAGRAVLELLGAVGSPGPDGFYTLWESTPPHR